MAKFPQNVSIVIVAHNALKTLPDTLESLKKANCLQHQITVVDVASTDGGAEWVEEQWPDAHVLRLDSNDGPNPARNAGIVSATTPYVLLMDSDVIIEPDTVPQLESVMTQDSSVAIASPIVLYGDRPDTIQYAGTGLNFICEAVNPWQGRSVDERGTELQDIGCASANALLISRDAAIRVGLFDERYFMGKEDGDFTHRIKLAGYKIMEVPQARVLHNVKPRGTGLYYFQIRNRWHFMLKNYQLRTLLLAAPALLLHELFQIALLTYKGHIIAYLKAIFGLLKMLPQLPSDRAKVATFRVKQDHEILSGNPIVVPEDFSKSAFMRMGKNVYEQGLLGYWAFLTKRFLHP